MVTSVELGDDAAVVTWPNGAVTPLPYLWLRDNCGCDQCRIAQTSEKQFHLTGVPVDLEPARVQLADDVLHVVWPDGHVTEFAGNDIRALVNPPMQKWRPWGADFQPLRADFDAFLAEDATARDVIEDFLETGAVMLVSAPESPNALEKLQLRLGRIREVVFDRIHNVVVDPTGYNAALTSLQLPPHNDLASLSWPPSAQALYMMVNGVDGGESIIVDGWRIASELRADRPELFRFLCDMPVPFRIFDDKEETFAVSPMITLDLAGEITIVRYSNQTMQPMDPTQPGVADFYRAYHEVSTRIMADSAKARFKLQSGDILLVAGHRVLHGREAFEPTGVRHLQDAYFEHDNIRNHLRVLMRRSVSDLAARRRDTSGV